MKIKNFLQKLLIPLAWPIYFILSRCFLKKRVLFISFSGKEYSDNPKAISDYLYKHDKNIKQVWLFQDVKKYKGILPKEIKCKKFNKLNLFLYLATSKIWIDNDTLVYKYTLSKMPKSKKQLFIETWHGDRGIKNSFYRDPSFHANLPFGIETKNYCDYLLTGCKTIEKAYREMFNYSGKFLKVGSPRNDILYDKQKVSEITQKAKQKLGINEKTKILLYAPTYKFYNESKEYEQIDFDNLLMLLEKQTGDDWVVVYRTHHIKRGQTHYDKLFDGRALFKDMAEILPAADMLITDYSSCAGDYMVLNRPIVLYIPDYEDFVKSLNGTWWDLTTETPFITAKDNHELCQGVIKSLSQKDNGLYDFYQCYENGKACKIIYEIIIKKIGE